jgi:hypothetical protein
LLQAELEDCISSNFFINISRAFTVVLFCSIAASAGDNVVTIIQRSVQANNHDWDAAPQFDYSERDQGPEGTKTYAVTMLYGSPYRRLIAVNGKRLSADKEAEEQRKFEKVLSERRDESPENKSARIAKYEAERKRDHTMLDQLTAAFEFTMLGEQNLNGKRVYVLRATPRKDYRPPNRDSQVLPGMEGRLWIDKATFQWVRVEAHVTHPVRIEGFLAEVEPGTQFQLEKIPVSQDIWLSSHFVMKSDAKVMLLFRHRSQEDDSFFNYHKAPAPPQEQQSGSASSKIDAARSNRM